MGFALAAENQEKILSITILNTWVDVVNFKKPWPMRPFEKPGLGEIELVSMQHATWLQKTKIKKFKISFNSKRCPEGIYCPGNGCVFVKC
ncbi:hypothetical protein [Salegentibacter salegens]|uniref:hypothetical protein n=1 Tax=Salegentibacter salegens TaxID=143223 RepID=UPI0021D099D8|nr:hypothetical protein [Salegentibacter salegens]